MPTYAVFTNVYGGDQDPEEIGRWSFDADGQVIARTGVYAEGHLDIRTLDDFFVRVIGTRGTKSARLVKDSVSKSVYSLKTEQTLADVGYLLVDDGTEEIVGFSGDNPPVGLVQGMTVETFRDENRGYLLEKVEDAEPVEGEDVEIDTSAEAARLIGVGVAAGLQASGVISKADEEQQIVYGWAYITHDKDGNVVTDKSGDFIDEVEEIEKSALNFMLHHRASDQDHTNVKGGDVIESMVFTPEKKAAMGIPEGTLPNGWWIGVKCSDEQWKGYKAGRKAFSIHGAGTRKSVED